MPVKASTATSDPLAWFFKARPCLRLRYDVLPVYIRGSPSRSICEEHFSYFAFGRCFCAGLQIGVNNFFLLKLLFLKTPGTLATDALPLFLRAFPVKEAAVACLGLA
jgi:hypothetical protein